MNLATAMVYKVVHLNCFMKKLCGRIFIVFIFLSASSNAATTYYDRQDGVFTINTTWSTTDHNGSATGSPPCTCVCSIAGNNVIRISHAITINCDMSFSGNPMSSSNRAGRSVSQAMQAFQERFHLWLKAEHRSMFRATSALRAEGVM